ncbi:hypothetical protein GLYMA_07G024801v4 [Glycine max]|nr:hypothetical protein GLYMA_07G024801v4 [Glycine max]KAH1085035.1 hypothetical protein GYH30_017187 [Glycine max]
MEIEELKGKLQVMKHLGDEDDAAVQNKTEEMNDELQEKVDNLENMEAMNQILVVKERQSNDELQEARKELIIPSVFQTRHTQHQFQPMYLSHIEHFSVQVNNYLFFSFVPNCNKFQTSCIFPFFPSRFSSQSHSSYVIHTSSLFVSSSQI